MKSLLNRLDKETFIFDLLKPVETIESLGNYSFTQIDSVTVEVELSKEQNLNELFTQFNQQNVEICSMKNKANRLEELFLALVEPTEATS